MKEFLKLQMHLALLGCLLFSALACDKATPGADSTATGQAPGVVQVAASPAPATGAAGSLADLSSLGLPVYPNLYESAWAGDMSDNTQSTRLGNLYTHDSFDKVYGWYKQQMPAGSEASESAASNHTTGDGDRAAMFEIGTTTDPKSKRVMITQDKGDGQTTIVLSNHFTK